ncbi:hypothetical protein AHAS_Ahas05G0197400 [Arachis hypogaea]
MGIKNGIALAWMAGYRKLWCESDSKRAFNLLKEGSRRGFHGASSIEIHDNEELTCGAILLLHSNEALLADKNTVIFLR